MPEHLPVVTKEGQLMEDFLKRCHKKYSDNEQLKTSNAGPTPTSFHYSCKKNKKNWEPAMPGKYS